LAELELFTHLIVTFLSAPIALTLLTLEMEVLTVAALVAEVIPKNPTHSAATVTKRKILRKRTSE
jgi:hypothetical protein